MADHNLCLQCQKIPFHSVFTTRIGLSRATNPCFHIGTLRERWTREGCDFCALIKHTFIQHYGAEYVETQLSKYSGCELFIYQSPVNVQHDIWDDSISDAEMRPFYLEVHSSKPALERIVKELGDEFSTEWVMPKLHLVLDDSQFGNTSTRMYGRAVLHDEIDWKYLAQWLNTCKNRHSIALRAHSQAAEFGKSRRPSPSLHEPQLLAIDVNRLCVVPIPAGAEYIALSYMWGKDQALKLKKANYELLQITGVFDPDCGNLHPCQTIVDAIDVTRRICYRYIWVDALCITQDDPQTILANVSIMDLIYAQAALTIVAAAGNNADSGLPGVSKDIPRTQQQMRQKVHGLVIANMLDSHNDAINHSVWNTRGWTYQERLLSPKLLIFTETQVYYERNQWRHFQEDLHIHDGSAILEAPDGRYQLDLEHENLFNTYALAVAEYTKRTFLFGLPVNIFDVGLFWTPIGACTRGDRNFPVGLGLAGMDRSDTQ